MSAYVLPLTDDEIKAIEFWCGRCCWADAAYDALREPDQDDPAYTPQGAGLYFETEAEAWDFKDQCEQDAEGGHSMFSGITFADKMLQFFDSIT